MEMESANSLILCLVRDWPVSATESHFNQQFSCSTRRLRNHQPTLDGAQRQSTALRGALASANHHRHSYKIPTAYFKQFVSNQIWKCSVMLSACPPSLCPSSRPKITKLMPTDRTRASKFIIPFFFSRSDRYAATPIFRWRLSCPIIISTITPESWREDASYEIKTAQRGAHNRWDITWCGSCLFSQLAFRCFVSFVLAVVVVVAVFFLCVRRIDAKINKLYLIACVRMCVVYSASRIVCTHRWRQSTRNRACFACNI